MRLSALLAAGLALTLALPADAQSFRARNGMRVAQDGTNSFSVRFLSGANEHDYWCAAGDFVGRALGLAANQPIYLLSDLPRKRGTGLRFSLSPEGANPEIGITIYGRDGPTNYLSAVSARNFCQRIPIIPGFDP